MSIRDHIIKLTKAYRESGRTDANTRKALQFARAYLKGEEALDKLRGRLIDKEIGTRYDHGAQIAILFNKETAPTEFAEYQSFRAACKAKVDADLATMKANLLSALE